MESTIDKNIFPQFNRYTTNSLSNKVKSAKKFVYCIVCSDSDQSTDIDIFISNNKSKIYNNPLIGSKGDKNLKICSVEIGDNNTILTLSTSNKTEKLSYDWATIDPRSRIVANGVNYELLKAEGIAVSPKRTYFSSDNQTITFRLIFPPIPNDTQTIDFIESYDSSWNVYNIKLGNM